MESKRIRELEAQIETLKYTLIAVMHSVDKWLVVEPYDPDNDPDGNIAATRAADAREEALKAIDSLSTEKILMILQMHGICDLCENKGNELICFKCKKGDDRKYWKYKGLPDEEEIKTRFLNTRQRKD